MGYIKPNFFKLWRSAMKTLSTIFFVIVSLFFFLIPSAIFAQQIFSEDFESGTVDASWGLYRAGEEFVTAVPMANAPQPLASGGSFVGHLQDIDASYTGAAIALAGSTDLQNYSIEGDVYCYVNHPQGSAYTGLAVYSDSSKGVYIKLAADFDADQRFRLYNNKLDPNTFQYSFHHAFTAGDVPGGIPTVDGWHNMKVEVRTINSDTTAFWCYFDGQMLAGCPIYDTGVNRMSSGQFGLYAFQQDADGIPGYFDNIVVNPLQPITSVEDYTNPNIPSELNLSQNYPNPFNPETKISYKLPENGFVSLTIHDLLGRKIKTLVSDYQQAGQYSVTWNGKDETGNSLASGIYLYTLKTGNILQSKKMILMK